VTTVPLAGTVNNTLSSKPIVFAVVIREQGLSLNSNHATPETVPRNYYVITRPATDILTTILKIDILRRRKRCSHALAFTLKCQFKYRQTATMKFHRVACRTETANPPRVIDFHSSNRVVDHISWRFLSSQRPFCRSLPSQPGLPGTFRSARLPTRRKVLAPFCEIIERGNAQDRFNSQQREKTPRTPF
jgi:hypothetical protein